MKTPYALSTVENFYSVATYSKNSNYESVPDRSRSEYSYDSAGEEVIYFLNKQNYKNGKVFQEHPRDLEDNASDFSDTLSKSELKEQLKVQCSENNEMNIEDFLRQIELIEKLDRSPKDFIKLNKTNLKKPQKNKINDQEKIKDMEKQIARRGKPMVKEVEKVEKRKSDIDNSTMHVVFGDRFNKVLTNICNTLQTIENSICSGVSPIEDCQDFFRRQRRATEFSSRFSRNYLYPLSRQIATLQKETSCNRLKRASLPTLSTIGENFFKAFQQVFNALMCYSNYVPISVDTLSHKKCQELIEHIYNLFDLLKVFTTTCNMDGFDAISSNIRTNCNALHFAIEEKKRRKEVGRILEKTEKTVKSEKPLYKQQSLEERLYMYWPPGVKSAKELYPMKKNVSSMKSCKVRKKPVVEDNVKDKPKTASLCSNKSYVCGKKISEDDIETMVGLHAKRSNAAFRKTEVEQDVPSVGETEHTKEIKKAKRPKNGLIRVPSRTISRSHITVSGSKNAKLYCIKHASCVEAKPELKLIIPAQEMIPLMPGTDQTLTKYRSKFEEYRHSKAMYGSYSDSDFCMLSNGIADVIAEQILHEIILELDLEEIVNIIFRSEFL